MLNYQRVKQQLGTSRKVKKLDKVMVFGMSSKPISSATWDQSDLKIAEGVKVWYGPHMDRQWHFQLLRSKAWSIFSVEI